MFFRSASEMQKHLVVNVTYRVGRLEFSDRVASGVSSTPGLCLTLSGIAFDISVSQKTG